MAKALHSTNVVNTFIRVAEDCPARGGEEPQPHGGKPTVGTLQYAMLAGKPYKYTSDDVVFATSAQGRGLDARATKKQRSQAREAFFSKGQPCMRASPLGKRFGWGVHADGEGRIAIYAVDSKHYASLSADPKLAQTRAMRSKRA